VPRDKIAIVQGARSAHGRLRKHGRGRTSESVGLGALLDRVLSIFLKPRFPSAADLFWRGDRLRHEGRYREAIRLVEEGLRRMPTSATGHLLAGYLHLAVREVQPAREAFRSVLALDPNHPRALLGLARIAIEGGDPDAARGALERALLYHPDFPEAQVLEKGLAARTAVQGAVAQTLPLRAGAIRLSREGRDPILARLDGTVIFAQCDEGREPVLAQHVIQVVRIASEMLARAGLGALRRGVIEGAQASMYLQTDVGLVLALTLPSGTSVADGWSALARLWAAKAQASAAFRG
jgi:tetratricopeptide (TPR) repeat protein